VADAIEIGCLFSGRVQGVGFRWRTVRLLAGTGVMGYVRNLADGRVEVRLQGERALVEAGLERVRQEMARYIEDCTVEERPIAEPLGEFTIRY
jgi:acylphosphatase